jgi:hypothetical protein
MDERQRLWSEILDRLPPGWRTTAPSFDPGRNRWQAVAIGPKLGGRRGPAPEVIAGVGLSEIDALRELAERLVSR